MILPILLALLFLLESSQALRRATMHLLICSNQEQKISAIEVNSLLETSLLLLFCNFSMHFFHIQITHFSNNVI